MTTSPLALPSQSPRLPIPAIGYIRVSKAREEMISPELQRLSIQQWAKRSNRQIVDWVQDLDASGRTWNRNIMSVITRVERKEAREVAVWKYSRFGRDRTGNAVNLGRLNRVGGELQSATEDIDATTAVGKLSRGLLMEIAAFESDRIGEGWAETWSWRLDQGLPARGGPRWGYEHVGRIPNPVGPGSFRDPRTQEAYRPLEEYAAHGIRAFEDYVNGGAYRQNARLFNRHGFVTTAGSPWRADTMGAWMRSGFWAGLLQIHNPDCPDQAPGHHAQHCPNRIYVPGAQEALISPDLWDAFLERSSKRARMGRGQRGSHHTLTGIFYCGHSGDRMTGGPVRGKITYRCAGFLQYGTCSTRAARDEVILPHVLADLGQWADRIEAAAAAAAEKAEKVSAPPKVDEIAEAKKEVAKWDRKIAKLVELYTDDGIARGEYDETRREYDEAKATAAARLEEKEKEAAAEVDPGERVSVARGLIEEWETLPSAHRRELLHQLVERITVFRESRSEAYVVVRLIDGQEQKHDISYDYSENAARMLAAKQKAKATSRA